MPEKHKILPKWEVTAVTSHFGTMRSFHLGYESLVSNAVVLQEYVPDYPMYWAF